MAKRGEFFPYRIHFTYPPSERLADGIDATNAYRTIGDVAREAAKMLRRGADIEVFAVEPGTKARTLLKTLTPGMLPELDEDEDRSFLGYSSSDRDRILKILNSEEPAAPTAPADPAVVYTDAAVTVQLKVADGDGRFDFLVPPGIPNIPAHFTDPRNYGPGDFYVRPKGITINYGHDGSSPAWTVDGVTFDGFWAKDGQLLRPLAYVRTPAIPGHALATRSAALDSPGVNDAVRALAAAYMPTGNPFTR